MRKSAVVIFFFFTLHTGFRLSFILFGFFFFFRSYVIRTEITIRVRAACFSEPDGRKTTSSRAAENHETSCGRPKRCDERKRRRSVHVSLLSTAVSGGFDINFNFFFSPHL